MRFVAGLPILGDVAEPRVNPVCLDAGEPIAMEELLQGVKAIAKFPNKNPGENGSKPRRMALAQVASGWLGGPAGRPERVEKKRRNTLGNILDRDIVDPCLPGWAPFTSSRASTLMLGRLPNTPGIFQVSLRY